MKEGNLSPKRRKLQSNPFFSFWYYLQAKRWLDLISSVLSLAVITLIRS